VDVNETDEYGYTGLHMAAENGHMEIVNILLVIVAVGRERKKGGR
jgi:ankyrin repeat protein